MKSILSLLTLAAGLTAGEIVRPPATRMNLVFIVADDLSPTLGCYSDSTAPTPTIDRLAREGVLFENAFCTAPSCSPSRASMLTSRYPHQLAEGTNLWGALPSRYPNVVNLLEKAGYRVGLEGKGWGPGDYTVGGYSRNPAGPSFPSFAAFIDSTQSPARTGGGAVSGPQPFFFWLGSQDPHRPYEPALKKSLTLRPQQLRVPANLPDTPAVRDDLLDYYQRPNILFILTDDHRFDGARALSTAPAGGPELRTPHLDRLIAGGTAFTHAHILGSDQPAVCAPSRAMLMTGKAYYQLPPGFYSSLPGRPADTNPSAYGTMPEYLRAAGYYCTNNSKTDYQFGAPFTAWDENGNKAHWRNRPPHGDGPLRRTGHGNGAAPFFSVINLEVTHESQIWARANQPLRVNPATVKLPPIYPDNAVIRRDVARNYDNIMVMDSLAGVILRQLEDDKLLDKTIVIFFSDHGSGLAWYKREIYDRGLHVPMIIRYPDGRQAGTWDEDLHSFVDLAPSMLSLAGVAVPTHLQGQAFLGEQRAKTPRQYIYAARDRFDEHYDCSRAVRNKRYKYIRNYQPDRPYYLDLTYRKQMPMMQEILRLRDAGQLPPVTQRWFGPKPAEELYDTQKDPDELTNLAQNPAFAQPLDELRRAEQQWVRAVHDKGFMQERDLIQLFWPGNQQPVTEPPILTRQPGRSAPLVLSCATEGASLGYKLDDGPWQLYSQPVTMPTGSKVTAKAIRIGYQPSPEVTL